MKKRYFIALLTIVVVLMVSSGCNSNNVKKQDSIDIAEITQGIDEKMELEALSFKEANQEKYDRHYSGDLYWQDFGEEKEIVDEAYKEKWTEYIRSIVEDADVEDFDFFVRADIQCINQSFLDLRNKKLEIEDIIENEQEHIWKMNIDIYYFQNESMYQSIFYSELYPLIEHYKRKGIVAEIITRGYNNDIFSYVKLDVLKHREVPILEIDLDSYPVRYAYEYYITENSKTVGSDAEESSEGSRIKKGIKEIEERHNEDIVYLYENPNNGKEVFALKSDLSLRFEVDITHGHSKYPAVMAQKMITKRIRDIVNEHEVSDKIVTFSTVEYQYKVTSELVKMNIDFKDNVDDLDFVNNFVPKGTQTTLYYLLEIEEEPDYEILKSIIEDYQEVYPDQEGKYFNVFVYFVRLPEQKREIVVDLFEDKDQTEYSFLIDKPGLDLEHMNIVRTDHEGFRFIDIYGEFEDYIFRANKEVKDKTINEFIEDHKLDGLRQY